MNNNIYIIVTWGTPQLLPTVFEVFHQIGGLYKIIIIRIKSFVDLSKNTDMRL